MQQMPGNLNVGGLNQATQPGQPKNIGRFKDAFQQGSSIVKPEFGNFN